MPRFGVPITQETRRGGLILVRLVKLHAKQNVYVVHGPIKATTQLLERANYINESG